MLFQKIASQVSLFGILMVVASVPALADSAVVNSDMMMSGPTSAAPIRLTIKHPKNTAMHVTIVTDESDVGNVDLNAPVNDAPTIAYAFPLNSVRNVKVYDGVGQEVWRLINGEAFAAPAAASANWGHAFLTDLYRLSAADPKTVQGFYALKIGSNSEFVSTTDMARIDTAGTPRRWAHHRPSVENDAVTKTTIVISPSSYESALSSRCAPTQ